MPEESACLLKVFSGPHVGAEILLGDGDYVIGSDEGCDVIFNDRFVAPRHAKLTIRGPAVRCAAVDGAGVFVNGERVEWRALANGDEIVVGRYRIQYLHLTAETLAAAPAAPPAADHA